MPTEIKVLRESVIQALTSIKEDNVSIAGITIDRRKLVEALKLQTQEGADILTVNYGMLSWHYDYKMNLMRAKYQDEDDIPHLRDATEWEYKPYTKEPEPCLQFSCNHTIMRFLNKPRMTHKNGSEIAPIKHLNFVDSATKQELNPLTGIQVSTPDLIEALTFVAHGVETDDSRPPLECFMFDCGHNVITLVTADGFRLPIAKIQAKGIPKDKILIYRNDIPCLLAYLKANTKGKGKGKYWLDTYLDFSGDKIKFSSDNGSIEFDKKDWGHYPDYTQLRPTDGTKIEFIASQMLEAVKAVSLMARDGSGIVRLQFKASDNYELTPGKITVTARSEELGDSTVEIDGKIQADCKIGANQKYLVDILSQCGDARISLKVTTPSSPMVFDINENRQETIMPMFVQWE